MFALLHELTSNFHKNGKLFIVWATNSFSTIHFFDVSYLVFCNVHVVDSFVTFLSKGHYKRAASRVMTCGSVDLTLLQNTAIDLHLRCFYSYYLLSYLISDHRPVKLLNHQIKFWEPSISSLSEHRHPTSTYTVKVYEAWSLAAEKKTWLVLSYSRLIFGHRRSIISRDSDYKHCL
jgi:hypothetical protein